MTLSTYLLYLAAVALLVLTPGPTMLMSMTNAVNHGTSKAMASVCGSVTAVLGVMMLSSLGLGALLSASELAFTVFKTLGAGYLIYLGIKTFRNPASSFDTVGDTQSSNHRSPRQLYIQGLLVGGSNPKALLFFAAFFPQFLNPSEDWAPQMAILSLTFVAFEFSVLGLCCLFVGRIAPWLRQPGRARWFNRSSGSLFASMGLLLLTVRRHTS
jgi:threonine/homoserine/homoserine lactone efflux protein